MIIPRYLTREVTHSLFAVTLVLLLIFLSNQLVRYLSYAASGKIAAQILWQLMGFEIPYLLALLLPLGLYLGIILTYGRLYADNELRIMRLYGLTLQQLIKITGYLALPIILFILFLMLWVNPQIATQKQKAILNADNMLETLIPGRFQIVNNGKRVIYFERISHHRKVANNLFIAEQRRNPNTEEPAWNILSAAQGYQIKDRTTHDHFFVATAGYRYEGIPGQNAYHIIQFGKYAIRAQKVEMDSRHPEQEGIPTLSLLHDYHDPLNAAELQWRLSIPLSAFVLSLIAVALSLIKPRQGRYAQLFPALLIYVVYVNLLFVARTWVEQKTVSIGLGMWWTHGLFLGIALLLLFNQPLKLLFKPSRSV